MSEFTKQDTFEQLAAIIAKKLSIDKTKIDLSSTLQNLGADSLDIVEIIMKIEDQFGIEVDDDNAENLHSMQELVDYIHLLRKK